MAAACSTAVTSAPLGKGDTLYVDVEASTLPPQPTDDGPSDDSPFARVDGSGIYGTSYDASYPVLTVCEPPDGSTSEKADSGKDASAGSNSEGADASAGSGDGGKYEAGAYVAGDGGPACTPLPAACASQPDCECLLGALASTLPCSYPHCSIDKGFQIYCP
jgi:hypothetical protein